MINWYRCLLQYSMGASLGESIDVPTLMIWGKQDPHLMWQMATASIEICTDGRLVYVEDAAHWVHQEKPEIVNPLLVEHLRS
jgi:pimeloyl-ACP methyl ester carboxylesterase